MALVPVADAASGWVSETKTTGFISDLDFDGDPFDVPTRTKNINFSNTYQFVIPTVEIINPSVWSSNDGGADVYIDNMITDGSGNYTGVSLKTINGAGIDYTIKVFALGVPV